MEHYQLFCVWLLKIQIKSENKIKSLEKRIKDYQSKDY